MKEYSSVAMYLRLSRDDGDFGNGKTESNSIRSQRELILSFIRSHADMKLYDIYIDDGYSGANFDRPQFQRMMQDVKAGKIDCIVVKDLSRFGRDYIEAGRLIQKTLPAFHVRFIALTDHFDSQTAGFHESSMLLPVKNFVNDFYCSDISQKVRSHQRIKREKGDYIGSFVAYGYRKNPKNKNKLIKDDYAAGVVEMIFSWRVAGMSMSGIAQKLDAKGILPPMAYRRMQGENFQTGFSSNTRFQWSAMAVKRILTNELYTGVMVQGKREVCSYKVKKMLPKPQEEWIRVPGTHEAIIRPELFETVQRMESVECRSISGEERAHLFTGLLFCGDCKKPMTRRIKRSRKGIQVEFLCSTKNRGAGCSRHTIKEKVLKKTILACLQRDIALFTEYAGLLNRLNRVEVDFMKPLRFDREIRRMQAEQEKYVALYDGLLADQKKGILTQEDYQNFRYFYKKQCQNLQEAIEKQEQAVSGLFFQGISAGMRIENLRQNMTVTECSREALVTFLNRIDIYEGGRIHLVVRYEELFQKIAISRRL